MRHPGHSEGNPSHFSGWSLSVPFEDFVLRVFGCTGWVSGGRKRHFADVASPTSVVCRNLRQEFQRQGFEMCLSEQSEVLFFKRER